jgi:hypothetical protein
LQPTLKRTAKPDKGGARDRMPEIRKLAERARNADEDNIKEALLDLEMRAGLNHWDSELSKKRRDEGRPCLVVNQLPQYVRQVTGDIRQMRPALKAHGVDDEADPEKAELVSDVLRYIESVSNATDAYFRAVDSQVTCGIGHWRIVTDYCNDDDDTQDILIQTVDDQVNVMWDPDANKPSREDARFCFVPVDVTFDEFKRRYPNASASSFDEVDTWRAANVDIDNWWTGTKDTVRIAEFWEREVSETTDAKTKRKRRSVRVMRSIVSGTEILEGPEEWKGRYIPIVPVIGEEVLIAGRKYRHGVVRFARDSQMRYNMAVSSETEIVALQPKAPFMATAKQIGDYTDLWNKANSANLPFLLYEPDPQAPGAPQRVQPPVTSSGFLEAMQRAQEEMHATTGIYPSALGARSNETSGTAIRARMQEGDTGTYVYSDNFQRALQHTGRVLTDLIPHYFDTTRTLRIRGEDGEMSEIKINQPQAGMLDEYGKPPLDPATRMDIGKYDVVVRAGPSYTTKREETREAMKEFMADPMMRQAFGDLYIGLMDAPNADRWQERFKELLPPPIKALEDKREMERAGITPEMQAQMQQQQVPPPEVIAQQAQAEVVNSIEGQLKQADLAIKAAQARKAEADAAKAEIEAQMAMQPPAPAPMPVEQPQPDPMEAIRFKALEKQALTEVDLQAEMVRRKMDRDAAQTTAMGMGEDAAEPTPMGPTPVELLAQAMLQQAQALQAGLSQLGEGMQALAAAQMAPSEIVRDEAGRPVGARKVVN